MELNRAYWKFLALLERARKGPAPLAIHSNQDVRKDIFNEALLDGEKGQVSGYPTPVPLVLEGYRGFNIFLLEGRYFAVPQEEGNFEGSSLRNGQYTRCYIGHTLSDIKKEIDRDLGTEGGNSSDKKEGRKEKALFICNVAPKIVRGFLDKLGNYDLTLLTAKRHENLWRDHPKINYVDSYGKNAKIIDLNQASPQLIQRLREHEFDLVVWPYEGKRYWRDTRLEMFVSAIANRLMTIFPDGQIRQYRGEDIRRISYNKAYLKRMLRFAPPLKGKRILEVGCSDGLACDLLLIEGPEAVVGVDCMEAVGCKYKDSRIIYFKMDASKLLFRDDAFDLCYSFATLEHVTDPFKVLQEMKRVTKKRGYCYVQAGPLYCSPFGHHMFGYFDDYPWIHLLLSKDEIIKYAAHRGVADQVKRDRGVDITDYISSMLNADHLNGLSFQDYRLAEFMALPDVKVLSFSRSYEGENLLGEEIIEKLAHIPKADLIGHGFELIFQVK